MRVAAAVLHFSRPGGGVPVFQVDSDDIYRAMSTSDFGECDSLLRTRGATVSNFQPALHSPQ